MPNYSSPTRGRSPFRIRQLLRIPCLNSMGWHNMAYVEWLRKDTIPPNLTTVTPANYPSTVVICIHGLTRTGRDFDALAQYLVLKYGYAVLCVDLPGRGRSDFLPNVEDYHVEKYAHDVSALISSLNLEGRKVIPFFSILHSLCKALRCWYFPRRPSFYVSFPLEHAHKQTCDK